MSSVYLNMGNQAFQPLATASSTATSTPVTPKPNQSPEQTRKAGITPVAIAAFAAAAATAVYLGRNQLTQLFRPIPSQDIPGAMSLEEHCATNTSVTQCLNFYNTPTTLPTPSPTPPSPTPSPAFNPSNQPTIDLEQQLNQVNTDPTSSTTPAPSSITMPTSNLSTTPPTNDTITPSQSKSNSGKTLGLIGIAVFLAAVVAYRVICPRTKGIQGKGQIVKPIGEFLIENKVVTKIVGSLNVLLSEKNVIWKDLVHDYARGVIGLNLAASAGEIESTADIRDAIQRNNSTTDHTTLFLQALALVYDAHTGQNTRNLDEQAINLNRLIQQRSDLSGMIVQCAIAAALRVAREKCIHLPPEPSLEEKKTEHREEEKLERSAEKQEGNMGAERERVQAANSIAQKINQTIEDALRDGESVNWIQEKVNIPALLMTDADSSDRTQYCGVERLLSNILDLRYRLKSNSAMQLSIEEVETYKKIEEAVKAERGHLNMLCSSGLINTNNPISLIIEMHRSLIESIPVDSPPSPSGTASDEFNSEAGKPQSAGDPLELLEGSTPSSSHTTSLIVSHLPVAADGAAREKQEERENPVLNSIKQAIDANPNAKVSDLVQSVQKKHNLPQIRINVSEERKDLAAYLIEMTANLHREQGITDEDKRYLEGILDGLVDKYRNCDGMETELMQFLFDGARTLMEEKLMQAVD